MFRRAPAKRLLAVVCVASLSVQGAQGAPANATFIPLDEARPVLAGLAAFLPPELKRDDKTLSRFWPEWVRTNDQQIRARLTPGDEDSLVTFLLFGTSFTPQPRITARQIEDIISAARDPLVAGAKLDALTSSRIDDPVAAAATSSANDRLVYARTFLATPA